ncbi:hypothetical protein HNQ91_001625 [Filimonas zeae]|uniref:Uncharacterized protein n=1 Tax=Filimonas zeae TaxID=1737353 RepID=A0A917MW59_9BACT|nr:hypothetical protein [Filimonas zeae]MDR6338574.1 hypothetical protein [Filimonas zeae]GGH67590.1 hypothetical protein GCM10011379_23030 [Filimonas zeae]
MTKVILDVPTDKMHSFIKLVLKLGIDKHTISSTNQATVSDVNTATSTISARPGRSKRSFSSFLLFDWEFFSNELEYE